MLGDRSDKCAMTKVFDSRIYEGACSDSLFSRGWSKGWPTGWVRFQQSFQFSVDISSWGFFLAGWFKSLWDVSYFGRICGALVNQFSVQRFSN